MILHLKRIRVVDGYIVDVAFNDGTQKRIDMKPLLWGPVFEPMRDPSYFAKVSIDEEMGVPVWPDGEDCAPEALYHAPEVNPDATQSQPSPTPPTSLAPTPLAAA